MKDDTISRQAAIEAAIEMFKAWYGGSVLRDTEIRARFEALPSEQPSATDTNVATTDTISREEALSVLNGCAEIYLNNLPPTIYKGDAIIAIKALPSAESELENKIRSIGYTGKEGRIYIGGRLFAVRELAQ